MRTFMFVALLAVCCLGLSGCFTYDADHNQRILRSWEMDIRGLHQDIDFIMGFDDDKSMMESYYR
jgi:hypothetical protein